MKQREFDRHFYKLYSMSGSEKTPWQLLRATGFKLVRFGNDEIMGSRYGMILAMAAAASERLSLPCPSPARGDG